MKIIQIDGFRGIVSAVFIGACLFAGFVIFPGLTAMTLWNKYLVSAYLFPSLNLVQGILLWAIIVILYSILSKKGLAVSFRETPSLSDAEFDMIMRKAKIHSQMRRVNNFLNKADTFEKSKKEVFASEKNTTSLSAPASKSPDLKSVPKEEDTVSNIHK